MSYLEKLKSGKFEGSAIVKFHENPSSGYCVVKCRERDAKRWTEKKW
jgi:hypothetical protein